MGSTFADAVPYLAAAEQLCRVRPSVLEEGAGRGLRIVDVDNGSGLSFTVLPDRAMDIVDASYRGVPVAFRTPGGYRRASGHWLRDWAGGLMTTCGLRNVGSPNGEFPLHGGISFEAAEEFSHHNAKGEIELSGRMREAVIFRENLHLRRTISAAHGCNRIRVEDCVTNAGALPEHIAILYHCNFGYPLVSPELRFEVPEHNITPRDEIAANGIKHWNRMEAPTPGRHEECFIHQLPAGDGGMAEMRIVNPALKIGAAVRYDTATLPRLAQWKLCARNNYVLGLEPTNGSLYGRETDLGAKLLPLLQPGEEIRFRLEIVFFDVV